MPVVRLCTAALRAATLAGAGILALAVVHFATQPLAGGDYFWQVRNGYWILDNLRLPGVESWSYTAAGTPWNDHEWALEVVFALLHRGAGWGGFRVLVLGVMGVAILGLGLASSRRAGESVALAVCVIFVVLCHYKFIPAPQLVSLGLFLLGHAAVVQGAAFRSRGGLAGLGALLLVWGNLSAEVLLFLPFAAAAAVRYVPWPDRRWAVLALLAVLPLVNPPGSSVLQYALHGSEVNEQVNPEFRALWEPAGTVPGVVKSIGRGLWALVVAGLVAAIARAPDRLGATVRNAPGLLAAAAALAYERCLWMLILPVLSLTGPLGRWRQERPARRLAADTAALLLAAGVGLAYANAVNWTPAAALRQVGHPAWPVTHLNPHTLPLACGEALAALPEGTRVFSRRIWGNYVLFQAPQVRVYIDGRNREYPVELHLAAAEVWAGGPNTAEILDRSGTQRVLADPGWSRRATPAAAWQPEATGTNCVLWRRSGAGG